MASDCLADCSHEIQVYQLLLIKVRRGNILENIWEERRDILAEGHCHNGFLDGLFSLNGISSQNGL